MVALHAGGKPACCLACRSAMSNSCDSVLYKESFSGKHGTCPVQRLHEYGTKLMVTTPHSVRSSITSSTHPLRRIFLYPPNRSPPGSWFVLGSEANSLRLFGSRCRLHRVQHHSTQGKTGESTTRGGKGGFIRRRSTSDRTAVRSFFPG